MRKLISSFIIPLLFQVPLLAAPRLPETIVKVGIVQLAPSVNLSSEGNYSMYEINSGEQTKIQPLNDYLVKADGHHIMMNGKGFLSPVRIVSEDENASIRVNGRRYRDNVIIRAIDGKLTVINELGIEDYLRGVLPMEIDKGWPEQSLKVQAVISRTYLLRNLRKHEKDGFDLCSGVHCQVYGGMEPEQKATNDAIEKTRGEVLVYDGKLAQALFFAQCGGHTEDPKYVWKWEADTPEYLKGRKCTFCKDCKHQNWKTRVNTETIRTRLEKAGFNVGQIKKISTSGKTPSGRALTIVVKSSKGKLQIPSGKFRMALSPDVVRSTMITDIVRYGDEYEFRGHGWGHGIGLCQWGCKVMGEKNYDYQEIIHYYYPGAKVEKWEE